MTTATLPAQMTNEDYHADLTRDSNSSLRMFRESVERYAGIRVHRTLEKPEPTEEMRFGTAFHTFLLEPIQFKKTYVLRPDVDRRTTAGKAIWQDYVDTLKEGQQTISIDDMKKLQAMRDGVARNPKAAAVLELSGDVERVFCWEDAVTGCPLKMKADVDSDRALILDLKTTGRDLSLEHLQRTIHNFMYHAQAALYLAGHKAVTGEDAEFAFLFVSKEPPHETAVVTLDADAMRCGEIENAGTLQELADRRARGDWNGRRWNQVLTVGLPRYAYSQR